MLSIRIKSLKMRDINLNNSVPSLDINELAYETIGAAIRVHRLVGVGLHEQTYKSCLLYELDEFGISYEENVEIPFIYKNLILNTGLSIDLLVEGHLIVNVKFSDCIDEKQILSLVNQLKYTNLSLGLIINFNSKFLKGDAIRRVINGQINGSNSFTESENI